MPLSSYNTANAIVLKIITIKIKAPDSRGPTVSKALSQILPFLSAQHSCLLGSGSEKSIQFSLSFVQKTTLVSDFF